MKLLKKIITSSLNETLGKFLNNTDGNRVLLYHSIGSDVEDDEFKVNTISADVFERQIDFLIKNKYQFTDVFDCSNLKKISICFDDGYKNNLYVAAPILEKYNIPFSVFVSTEKLQSGHKDYLNKEELKILVKNTNVTIGTHGHTHKPFNILNQKELESELRDSKQILEEITGNKIESLSYPHGIFTHQAVKSLEGIGYKYAFSSIFGINTSLTNRFILKRNVILGTDTHNLFLNKVNGQSDWRALFQKNKFLKSGMN